MIWYAKCEPGDGQFSLCIIAISNKQISKSISNNPQINLGPQHPSTHGVLRIIAFVAGETIKWLQLEIGLLHRGTEKLIEYKTYNQSIPYFNRLDYVSLIAQEEIYINNIEKLLNLRISRYGSVVRTIFLEISRILNHLLAVTSNAIDVGAFTPFLLGFEEREKLMSFYEAISSSYAFWIFTPRWYKCWCTFIFIWSNIQMT